MPSANQLSIANVVTVSVANPPAGLSAYKINNLAYFTKEEPIVSITNYAIYLDPEDVATDWGVGSETYQAALKIFAQEPNILDGDGALIICPMDVADTLTTMLAKIGALIFFGGALYGGYAPNDAEILAGANAFQAAKKMLFASQNLATSMDGGGIFNTIQAANLSYCRMLLYTVGAVDARLMACAYASRAMSVDFSGSNTTLTMHLKDLVGVTPDPGITQTILNTCGTIGVDVYVYVGPLPKVFTSGGNTFYDQVYGTLWLIFALQVAGFNALATTFTKVPQTEPGMSIIRNAYIGVCQLAVTNGFVAPGSWNSPQLFGNPDSLRKNILERGFYVYSAPVNQQPQVDREDRKAPLVQIALKLGGAIHSTSVIVYINP